MNPQKTMKYKWINIVFLITSLLVLLIVLVFTAQRQLQGMYIKQGHSISEVIGTVREGNQIRTYPEFGSPMYYFREVAWFLGFHVLGYMAVINLIFAILQLTLNKANRILSIIAIVIDGLLLLIYGFYWVVGSLNPM